MFKTVQVVMLPTNNESNLALADIDSENCKLVQYTKLSSGIQTNLIPQNLYFYTNEDVKKNEWGIWVGKDKKPFLKKIIDERNEEYLISSTYDMWVKKDKIKKIIATTDKSLYNIISLDEPNPNDTKQIFLPEPPQSFLEYYVAEYNKGNIITEVMVEYKWGKTGKKVRKVEIFDDVLNINPEDNTITIKLIKDSWSIEELIALTDTMPFDSEESRQEWIEKNL